MHRHFRYLCCMTKLFLSLFLLAGFSAWSQELKVEYDKTRDFSQYKTFRFGEGEIITPKDDRLVNEDQVKKWVINAVTSELKNYGLQRVDSAADLVISFVAGSLARTDAGSVGPMGLTPGSMERNYSRDYRQGSLVIDMHDKKDFLVWRINSTTDLGPGNGESLINSIVQKGYKPYGKMLKSKKKKK
jgi:hypothetical protein